MPLSQQKQSKKATTKQKRRPVRQHQAATDGLASCYMLANSRPVCNGVFCFLEDVMATKITNELESEILAYPQEPATAYGGHIVHLWIRSGVSGIRNGTYVRSHAPLCGKDLVFGFSGVILGRNVCESCLKTARKLIVPMHASINSPDVF